MGGAEVRLSDFLINVKLPRRWRDRLPLLVSDQHILWVAGLRLSQRARVCEDSSGVITLRLCGP
jgi:tRNA(Ile)-lysidine synthase